jgi:hypothetical protein
MIERVISGGQTGADQAGLAVARRLGIPTGGCMPKGWLTEAGPRPDLGIVYGLQETKSAAYSERTERNVLASDGTVVFGDDRSRGSMLTARLCGQHGKPCLVVSLDSDSVEAADTLRAWIAEHRVKTLNVAGNRAGQAPGIVAFVTTVLEQALGTERAGSFAGRHVCPHRAPSGSALRARLAPRLAAAFGLLSFARPWPSRRRYVRQGRARRFSSPVQRSMWRR